MLYCVYWCLCPRLGLFMSYLCDTFFIFIFIFIFITINHLISLEQTFLLFGHFFKSSVSGVAYFLLNFFFVNFSLVSLTKVLLIKVRSTECFFNWLQHQQQVSRVSRVYTCLADKKHAFTEAIAQRCPVKKLLYEILPNSQENTCFSVSFLIKLLASAVLKTLNI